MDDSITLSETEKLLRYQESIMGRIAALRGDQAAWEDAVTLLRADHDALLDNIAKLRADRAEIISANLSMAAGGQTARHAQAEQVPVARNRITTPILFLHAPKSGGVSINEYFKTLYAPEKISPIRINTHDETKSLDLPAMRSFDYMSGHFGYEFVQAMGDKFKVVSNFRHPVTRVRSLYTYYRFNKNSEFGYGKDHPIALAKSTTFSEFIRLDNDAVRAAIENSIFHQWLSDGTRPSQVTRQDVETVKQRIDAALYLYVVEFPEASESFFERVFGFRPAIPYINRSQGPGSARAISPDDVDVICRNNTIDLEIYNHAVGRLFALRRD